MELKEEFIKLLQEDREFLYNVKRLLDLED